VPEQNCIASRKVNQKPVELPCSTLRQIIDIFGEHEERFVFICPVAGSGGILGAIDDSLDIDSTIKAGVTLGSGVVLVCDQETCAVDFLLNVLNFFEHESCGQCIPCKLGTSQLHYVAQKFAMREAEEKDIQLMIDTAKMMKLASLCALGQSPILPIETMIRNFREEFVKHCDPDYECPQCDASLQAYYL
jgi:NADH-quinone oxidoreductase subunit F